MTQHYQTLIQELLSEVRRSPAGTLSLQARKRLWISLVDGRIEEDGKRLLTALDVWCVESGMPIWRRAFGCGDLLSNMLDVAVRASSGRLDPAEALAIRDEFYVTTIEDIDYAASEYPAMFVAHAAANTILTGTTTSVHDADDGREDVDLESEAFEPSFLVASAFAGRLFESGDSAKRRAFWEAYLLHSQGLFD